MQDARTHIALFLGRHSSSAAGLWTYSLGMLRELLFVAGREEPDFCFWAFYDLPVGEDSDLQELRLNHPQQLRLCPLPQGLSRRLGLVTDLPRSFANFDLVHGSSNYLPCGKAARRVITMHDCFQAYEPLRAVPSLRNIFFRAIGASMLHQSSLVLCERKDIAAEIRERFKFAGRIEIVEPPLDFPNSAKPAETASYFLHMSNGDRRKNSEALLSALPSNIELKVICSNVNARDHLKAYASSKGLNCEFILRPTRIELFELMACSRGLLFPSLAEGFGYPVFEALACGVPVLCQEDYAPADLQREYPGFFYCFEPKQSDSLGQTLAAMSKQEVPAAELRQQLSACVKERFSPGRFGTHLLSLYRSLLAKS